MSTLTFQDNSDFPQQFKKGFPKFHVNITQKNNDLKALSISEAIVERNRLDKWQKETILKEK